MRDVMVDEMRWEMVNLISFYFIILISPIFLLAVYDENDKWDMMKERDEERVDDQLTISYKINHISVAQLTISSTISFFRVVRSDGIFGGILLKREGGDNQKSISFQNEVYEMVDDEMVYVRWGMVDHEMW